MSHLGAYFWLRLKKATYELDGLSESSLPLPPAQLEEVRQEPS